MNSNQALTVKCNICGSKPGAPCVSLNGRQERGPHMQRETDAFYAAGGPRIPAKYSVRIPIAGYLTVEVNHAMTPELAISEALEQATAWTLNRNWDDNGENPGHVAVGELEALETVAEGVLCWAPLLRAEATKAKDDE